MNEAVAGGGGDRELPAEGTARLRLISYIELGVHEDGPPGQKKNKELVYLEFELHGPKWPATNPETGRTTPLTISFTMPLSLNEKANYFKMFKRLNHTGEYTHFAQLLGGPFIGSIHHNSSGEGDQKKTYANLRNEDGYTIRSPYIEDIENGGSKLVTVPPAISALRCFLWEYADKEMWDSIFIDGQWDDKKDSTGKVIKAGTSKNYFQNRIKAAQNFKGSSLAELMFAGGVPDLPDAEQPPRAANDDDLDGGLPEQTGADGDPLADLG